MNGIQKIGRIIPQVTEIKFLGVILNENLSWIAHIEYLAKKLKISVGGLIRIHHVVPKVFTIHYLSLI